MHFYYNRIEKRKLNSYFKHIESAAMNKYVATLIFYAVAIAVIVVLHKLSPDAQDGGPGLGSLAILLLAIIMVVLIGLNIYRGVRIDKSYFVIAAIHALVLIIGGYKLFI